MTVQIGNIVLSDHLRLRGILTAPTRAVQPYISFDGTVDVLSLPAQSKRMLVIEAVRNGSKIEGYFTRTQIEGMRSIADAGQATTLIHDRGTFTVLITGGFDTITPIINYRNPSSSARYVGAITLLEV